MWAYAREGSAKEQMRICRADATRRDDYAEVLQDRFSEPVMYDKFVGEVLGRSNLKPKPVTGISFCIPTNGSRPEKTNLTIKSILREMGDFPHEIIIAGDISKFTDNDGIILVDKSDEAHSRKVAALRNTAADSSNFDTIVWCDDDVILGKDWLKSMLDYSVANGWEVLGNKVLLPDGGRYWDRATLNPHKMVSYAHPEYDTNLYQSSAFMIVRKSVFEKVRWNEECLVYADREGKTPEDIQYSLDLIKNSFRISFNEDSVVWHNDDTYCEFEELCLKKELITERFGIDFFASNCEEFEGLFVDS